MKFVNTIKMRNFLRNFSAELIIIIAAIGGLILASPVATEAKYNDDIATKEKIVNNKKTGVVLLDRNDKVFFTFYDGKDKKYIPLSEIAQPMQQAVIVAEDENFYQHDGVSYKAMLGALAANLRNGTIAFGGSTITQQLAKNTLLDSERTMLRKYEEVFLAKEIEERYSKEEILEMYLNTVYFGEGAYGIDDAARTYFGKNASDLDVSEASMLAGIISAPSTLSPISGNPEKAKEKQLNVLDEMVEDKYISQDQKQTAAQKELYYSNDEESVSHAPHFAFLVKQQLLNQYGEEKLAASGMKVHTTLDLESQLIAEQAVTQQMQELAGNKATNASVVVIDPATGEILSLVGSADWQNEQFGKVNMAVTPRQPGSAFKPIVYLAAFEKQTLTPSSILIDVQRTFENSYKPNNYDNSFRGPVTARYALANSLNVPAVEVMTDVGINDGIAMAKRLGITTLQTPSNYGPSFVLGTGEVSLLEMTNAYATFANEGVRHEPLLITSIDDKYGNEIYREQPVSLQVVDPKYVFLVSSILSDKKSRSDVFGSKLDISRPAAVKTGTTEYFKDAWTIGYTQNLAVGVWVGNNDNTPMDSVAGSFGAGPIWKAVMEQVTAGTASKEFQIPSGITAKSVCADNEKKTFKGDGVDTEFFVQGTESKACQPLERTRLLADEEVKKALASLDGKKDEDKEQRAQDSQPQPTSPQQPQEASVQNIEQEMRRIIEENRNNDNRNERRRGNGNGRGHSRND